MQWLAGSLVHFRLSTYKEGPHELKGHGKKIGIYLILLYYIL